MKINWKSIAISSAASLLIGVVAAWAAQTNYLGTVFVADPTIPTRQLTVNLDGSINANVVSVGGVASISGGTTGLTPNSATTGIVTLVNPATVSTASQLVARDASQNAFANNFVSKATNNASGAGTTTLTAASTRFQNFTGASTQTYKLPDATTLSIGSQFQFNNNGGGIVTVADNGSNAIITIPPGGVAIVLAIAVSTTNGAWDSHPFLPLNAKWGTGGPQIGPLLIASTLPACAAGTAGQMAYVTDGDSGLAWGATAVNSGGSSTKYLVWCNATNWTVAGK